MAFDLQLMTVLSSNPTFGITIYFTKVPKSVTESSDAVADQCQIFMILLAKSIHYQTRYYIFRDLVP